MPLLMPGPYSREYASLQAHLLTPQYLPNICGLADDPAFTRRLHHDDEQERGNMSKDEHVRWEQGAVAART